ncbi:KdsC family phosphatase [Cryobacterium sp. AP23]
MIKLLLLDVDGVLTDGTLFIGSAGEAYKGFSVRDGLAVALLRAHGIRTGILSGKSSPSLDFRITQLGIDLAITGRIDKQEALAEILQRAGLTADEVAYVGDDVVDLPLAGLVGQFYAPADAHPLVKQSADYVLSTAGGRGAAREAAEYILDSAGLSIEQAYAPLIGQWGVHRAIQ